MKNILIIFLSILLTTTWTQAANYKTGEIVDITSATLGDYYIAGKEVTISTIIFGDVIAGGENVWIKDSILGDILIGAAKIDIDGPIGDDARLSAGEIVINSRIEGDLIVFAGSVRVTEHGSISGDVICYAGEITIYGHVGGDLIVAGGEITLKNTIGGNVEIKGGEVYFDAHVMGTMEIAGQEIKLGENASCDGAVTYWSGEGEIDFTNVASSATFSDELAIVDEEKDWSSIVTYLGLGVIAYWIIFILSALMIIMFLEYLFGQYFNQAAELLTQSMIKGFGYGMLFFIGIPVLTVILLVSLVGIPLGIFTLSIYLLALLFSTTITAMITAHYFKNKSSQEWTYMQTVGYTLLTVVILKIIYMIPFVGSILKKIAAAFAYGALIMMALGKKASKLTRNN